MGSSRRQFLRATGLLAAASALPRGWGRAEAATLSGYAGHRSAVCVFLLGGNDSNNLLVPLEAAPYDKYIAARPNVGFTREELEGKGITPAGSPVTDPYGLHPQLNRVRALFAQGQAAVVCNVGPLVKPLRKADYLAGALNRPDNLFSHSDQQNAWASAIANPSSAVLPLPLIGKVTGWGGRSADKLSGLNPGEYPEVTSFGGKALFGAGASRRPMTVSPSGVLGFKKTPGDTAFTALQQSALTEVMAIHNDVTLEHAYGGEFATAQEFAAARADARDAAWKRLPTTTQAQLDALFEPPEPQPTWSLPGQLKQVLRDLIAGATPEDVGGLGLKRQLFSVGLGGFDTHSNQKTTQEALYAQLDFALDAFHQAMGVLKAVWGTNAPQATLFTMSDFSRTLQENADKGTDHGWGGHALVIGERVAGQRLYGVFPNLDLSNDGAANTDTTDGKGRWIPTLSVEQYAFSLMFWLGLTGVDRPYVFPNLDAYMQAAEDGGFPGYMQRARIAFMMPDA